MLSAGRPVGAGGPYIPLKKPVRRVSAVTKSGYEVQVKLINVPDNQHFRVVFLPHTDDLTEAFGRIARFLDHYRKRHNR